MRIAKKRVLLVGGLLAFALMGGSLSAASAEPGDSLHPQLNGSEGALYLFSSSGTLIDDPSHVFARAEPIYASGNGADLMDPVLGSPEATGASTESYTFIASADMVRASGRTSWEAWAPSALSGGGVIAPTLTAHAQSGSNGGGLDGVFLDVGGSYLLGVAFTKNRGLTVDSALYRTMHILPGNRFTIDPIELEAPVAVESPVGIAQPDPVSRATSAPAAQAAAQAPTEAFELIMPAAGTIDLGSAARRASTSAAELGQFTVIADRTGERGWELSVVASDFLSGEHRIAATALGYAPIGLSQLPTGVTLGAAKAAGAGTFGPIVMGEPSSTTTALGIDLNLNFTFVPPEGAAAGTYLSTVSLDLVSK